MLFCRDRHDVPASQSAQDCLQTMKSYGIQTTGHCNPVRKNELKSMHPIHRMQQLTAG